MSQSFYIVVHKSYTILVRGYTRYMSGDNQYLAKFDETILKLKLRMSCLPWWADKIDFLS
jgi:hypothetical protein